MQVGAIFGLVFALIVMGFVLLFGSGQIVNLLCMGGTSQTNKVVSDLMVMVDDIQASGEGSSDTLTMRIADGSDVCFVDPAHPGQSISNGWVPDPDLMIEQEIQDNGYNIWIEHGCGGSMTGLRVAHLVPRYNFCARSGEVVLVTNVGADVRIERLLA